MIVSDREQSLIFSKQGLGHAEVFFFYVLFNFRDNLGIYSSLCTTSFGSYPKFYIYALAWTAFFVIRGLIVLQRRNMIYNVMIKI